MPTIYEKNRLRIVRGLVYTTRAKFQGLISKIRRGHGMRTTFGRYA